MITVLKMDQCFLKAALIYTARRMRSNVTRCLFLKLCCEFADQGV